MALPLTSSLPQNANIISRWEMATSGSGIVADSVGSNTLTNNGTVTSVSGQFSVNAASFNGTNQWLSITNASQFGLGLSGDFSMSVWVNLNAITGTYTFMGKYLSTGNQRSYLYQTQQNNSNFTTSVSNNGTSVTAAQVAWTASAGTWYLVSMSYVAAAGSVAFYINGVQQGTTQTGQETSLFSTSTSPFAIGAWGGAANDALNGILQDALIWNVSLSGANMTSLYNAYFPPASSGAFFRAAAQ